ncbi:MAG TPA: DUF4129 domain-containing protein [Candidatus Angelobacter sp.]|nr:DUF4129 domain-containing protein [Candidatus Angelobacter sp.]
MLVSARIVAVAVTAAMLGGMTLARPKPATSAHLSNIDPDIRSLGGDGTMGVDGTNGVEGANGAEGANGTEGSASAKSSPPESGADKLSLQEYRQQLADISDEVDAIQTYPERAGKLAVSTPEHVVVLVDGHGYKISYAWLKLNLSLLQLAKEEERKTILEGVRGRLESMRKEAAIYEGSGPGSRPDRAKLNEILARREFRGVHGPTLWDQLRAYISDRISKFLDRISRARIGRVDFFQILVYGVIVLAVLLLAWWVVQNLSRSKNSLIELNVAPFAPSAKGWRKWLAEAQGFARRQDWRNGIHLAYWAGISFLEERGAWKPDRARTPREYLRLMNTQAPEHAALLSLTKKFEVCWYGHRASDESDFKEALVHLEELGCR